MTATNHALIGATIGIVVKNPAVAIPAAFASHFVADLVPHYNPPNLTRDNFESHYESWSAKVANKTFRFIFVTDMLLLACVLVVVPLIAPADVSAWTVLLCALAAISPDFLGGFEYLGSIILGIKPKKSGLWAKIAHFHVGIQWMERPWGIWVELVVFGLMLVVIYVLSK